MAETKRAGRFTLTNFDDREAVLAIMGRCVIRQAQYSFVAQGIEYFAESAYFDEIECPCGTNRIPVYEWEITRNPYGPLTVRAVREPEPPTPPCPHCQRLREQLKRNNIVSVIATLSEIEKLK